MARPFQIDLEVQMSLPAEAVLQPISSQPFLDEKQILVDCLFFFPEEGCHHLLDQSEFFIYCGRMAIMEDVPVVLKLEQARKAVDLALRWIITADDVEPLGQVIRTMLAAQCVFQHASQFVATRNGECVRKKDDCACRLDLRNCIRRKIARH